MERRSIVVSGIVQGVGFRPFVYGLASRMGLSGFVKNQSSGVLIEIEGETPALDDFLVDIASRPPPLAQIGQLRWERRTPTGDYRFRIEPSEDDASRQIFISPDVSTCRDCLAEIGDPEDRRYRYPFLNCTHCGPRLTIVTGAPYDRERTTMAGVRHVRRLPGRVRGPRRPPLPRPADRLPGLRPAAHGPGRERPGRSRPVIPSDGSRPRSCVGQDRRPQGPGGLSPRLRRAEPGGSRRTAPAQAPRREAVRPHGPGRCRRRRRICEVAPAERALLGRAAAPIVLLRRRLAAVVAPQVAPGTPASA